MKRCWSIWIQTSKSYSRHSQSITSSNQEQDKVNVAIADLGSSCKVVLQNDFQAKGQV